MAFIIAIEGIDASGKKTACATLSTYLKTLGLGPVASFDFPNYNGPCGDLIAKLLKTKLSEFNTLEQAKLIQSVMLADRLDAIAKFKKFPVTTAAFIVCDRYYMSGIVYGWADGLSAMWLEDMHCTMPRADLQILIDVDPVQAAKRRDQPRDEYEKDLNKQLKVRDKYLEIWHDNSDKPGWAVVDGSQSASDVSTTIRDAVSRAYLNKIQKANFDAAI